MEKIVRMKTRLYYIPEIGTLDLWIDDPCKEVTANPIDDNIVLKLDEKNNIIGIEIISLEKLGVEDLEKIPKNIRKILQKTLEEITLKTKKLI